MLEASEAFWLGLGIGLDSQSKYRARVRGRVSCGATWPGVFSGHDTSSASFSSCRSAREEGISEAAGVLAVSSAHPRKLTTSLGCRRARSHPPATRAVWFMVRSGSISASAAHEGVSGEALRDIIRDIRLSVTSLTGSNAAGGLEVLAVHVHFQPPGTRQYPAWQPVAHRVDRSSSAVTLEHALASPAASSAEEADASAVPSGAGAVAAAPHESQVSIRLLSRARCLIGTEKIGMKKRANLAVKDRWRNAGRRPRMTPSLCS